MPADRGSDILCMLMPHNVGFVPLFGIYLFGSSTVSRAAAFVAGVVRRGAYIRTRARAYVRICTYPVSRYTDRLIRKADRF